MTNQRKNKLQDAMNAVREVFYDSIECRVRYSGKSYAAISYELGCSEQLVFQVAKLRGLGRNSQQSTSTCAVADANGDAERGGHHE